MEQVGTRCTSGDVSPTTRPLGALTVMKWRMVPVEIVRRYDTEDVALSGTARYLVWKSTAKKTGKDWEIIDASAE